jgi:hypothetical protein
LIILQKEVQHYKSNLFELVKQKDKEERIPVGVLLIDEAKGLLKESNYEMLPSEGSKTLVVIEK